MASSKNCEKAKQNEMAESERNLLISSALARGNRKREELDLRKVARCRYKLFTRASEREEGRKGKGPNRRHLSLQNAVVKQVTCTRRKIYLTTVHWGICERRPSTSAADCIAPMRMPTGQTDETARPPRSGPSWIGKCISDGCKIVHSPDDF